MNKQKEETVTVYVYCIRAQETVNPQISRECFNKAVALHFPHSKTPPLRGEEPSGKPCFPLEPREQFSVSHTGRFFAVAFCRGARVGLDLQTMDPRIRPLALARRFFSLSQVGALERSRDPQGDFFRLWTQKEAAVKLTGEGLSALSKGREEEFFSRDLSCVMSRRLGERLFCSLACEREFTVRIIGGNDL